MQLNYSVTKFADVLFDQFEVDYSLVNTKFSTYFRISFLFLIFIKLDILHIHKNVKSKLIC